MAGIDSNDMLLQYLTPEWRNYAMNPEEHVPVGFPDALLDAVTRMVDDEKNICKKSKEENTHPDWITDEQWKAVPSAQWWEDSRRCAEYLANAEPVSREEALAQFERLRQDPKWHQGG